MTGSLQDALRPFAKAAEAHMDEHEIAASVGGYVPLDDNYPVEVPYGDLRRARSALAALQPPAGKETERLIERALTRASRHHSHYGPEHDRQLFNELAAALRTLSSRSQEGRGGGDEKIEVYCPQCGVTVRSREDAEAHGIALKSAPTPSREG